MSISHQQMPQYQSRPQPVMAPQVQQRIVSDMIWVRGIEGAKGYFQAPNTTVPLWDSEAQSIYIKSTDQNGIPRPLTILDYTIREPLPEKEETQAIDTSNFVTKDEFNELRSMISDLSEKLDRKPNRRNGNFKPKKGEYDE